MTVLDRLFDIVIGFSVIVYYSLFFIGILICLCSCEPPTKSYEQTMCGVILIVDDKVLGYDVRLFADSGLTYRISTPNDELLEELREITTQEVNMRVCLYYSGITNDILFIYKHQIG